MPHGPSQEIGEITCLFCCSRTAPSNEHIFCEALGHFVVIPDVCRPCNNTLGAGVDAAADADPILAWARKRAGLPIRGQAVREVADAIDTTGRTVPSTWSSRSASAVAATTWEDGALIVSEEVMPKELRTTIKGYARREGLQYDPLAAEATARELLTAYELAPVGAVVRAEYLGHGVTITKGEVDSTTTVHFRDEEGTDRLFAKIAIEFVAYTLGEASQLLDPGFDEVRRFVRFGDTDAPQIATHTTPTQEGASNCAPSHTLTAFHRDGRLYVRVGLFEGYVREVLLGPAIPNLPADWFVSETFPVPGRAVARRRHRRLRKRRCASASPARASKMTRARSA